MHRAPGSQTFVDSSPMRREHGCYNRFRSSCTPVRPRKRSVNLLRTYNISYPVEQENDRRSPDASAYCRTSGILLVSPPLRKRAAKKRDNMWRRGYGRDGPSVFADLRHHHLVPCRDEEILDVTLQSAGSRANPNSVAHANRGRLRKFVQQGKYRMYTPTSLRASRLSCLGIKMSFMYRPTTNMYQSSQKGSQLLEF